MTLKELIEKIRKNKNIYKGFWDDLASFDFKQLFLETLQNFSPQEKAAMRAYLQQPSMSHLNEIYLEFTAREANIEKAMSVNIEAGMITEHESDTSRASTERGADERKYDAEGCELKYPVSSSSSTSMSAKAVSTVKLPTWEPPRHDTLFVGRTVLLECLRQKLDPKIGADGERKSDQEMQHVLTLQACAGLGGVGKTHLALEYLYKTSYQYTLKIWFQAGEDPDTLYKQYQKFAEKLGFYPEKLDHSGKIAREEVLAFVKHWLLNNPGWLIIYDNVMDYASVEPFLPRGGGNILITTRCQQWPKKVNTLIIDVLSPEDAVEFLNKLIGTASPAYINLAKNLGYLPLALAQAGAYILNTDISAEDYLIRYKLYEKKMLADESLPPGVNHVAVASTWNLSLKMIKKKWRQNHVAIYGKTLLPILAYLSPDNIPRSFLLFWLKKTFPKLEAPVLVLDAILASLGRYSLINLNKDYISLHRLVQTVLRHQHENEANIAWFTELLQIMHEYMDIDSMELPDHLKHDRLFPHCQSILSYYESLSGNLFTPAYAFILRDIGVIEDRNGKPNIAEEHIRKALRIQEAYYGTDNYHIAKTLFRLHYTFFGDVSQKKALLNRALKIQREHYGNDHWEVATTLLSLTNLFSGIEEAKEQEEILQSVLKIFMQYGETHWRVGDTLEYLSTVYGVLGDLQKKLILLKQALVIHEHNFGLAHWWRASILSSLGSTYCELGDYEQWKICLEEALKIIEQRYGTESIKNCSYLLNLSNAYWELGDEKQSKLCRERALKIESLYHGPNNILSLGILGYLYQINPNQIPQDFNLSLLHAKQRIPYLEKYVVELEKYHGDGHIETVSGLEKLAEAYSEVRRLKRRKEIVEKILTIKQKYYGPNHRYLIVTYMSLADAYKCLGYRQATKEYLEIALRLQEANAINNHGWVTYILEELASAYDSLGDTNERKKILERCLLIKEKAFGPQHWKLKSTLLSLADTYTDLGDIEEQFKLLERAVNVIKLAFGENHRRLAEPLIALANAYGNIGKPDLKIKYIKNALEIYQKDYPEESIIFVGSLIALAEAHGELGDAEQKSQILERVLKIQEDFYETDQPCMENTLVNLGRAYNALDKVKKQKKLLERALSILENNFGPNHPRLSYVLDELGEVYDELGDPRARIEYLERALRIQEEFYKSKDDIRLAPYLENLGSAYRHVGDYAKARSLTERALSIEQKYYKADNTHIAITLINLAKIYEDLPEFEKTAGEYWERALDIEERFYSRTHIEITPTLYGLAVFKRNLGRTKEAQALLQRALEIEEKHYAGKYIPVAVAVTLEGLANVNGDLGNPQEKKKLMERALAMAAEHHGEDNVELASTLVNLGDAYGDLGDAKGKKTLVSRALEMEREDPDLRNQWGISETLVSLAEAHRDLEEFEAMKQALKEALEIQIKHFGPKHWQVGITLANLADARGFLGDNEQREKDLREVLDIQEPYYGKDHWQVALTLLKLGNALGCLGEHKKKREVLEKALKIQIEFYGEDHWRVALTNISLAGAFSGLENPALESLHLERGLRQWHGHNFDLQHPYIRRILVQQKLSKDPIRAEKSDSSVPFAFHLQLETAPNPLSSALSSKVVAGEDLRTIAVGDNANVQATTSESNAKGAVATIAMGSVNSAILGALEKAVSTSSVVVEDGEEKENQERVFRDSKTVILPGTIINISATNSGVSAKNVSAIAEAHFHLPAPRPRIFPLREQIKTGKPAEWSPSGFALPSQTDIFIGREALLHELEKELQPGEKKGDAGSIVILAGLGGIGKTQLALRFIRKTRHAYFLKIWMPADNKEVLEQHYLRLYDELNLGVNKESPQAAIERVKYYFSEHPNWLIVFDNASKYKDIEPFIPQGGGHVLVTSRYQLWPKTAKKLNIDVMDKAEAFKLLLAIITDERKAVHEMTPKEQACAFELIEALGYLPLAIAQAGAYIAATPDTIEHYHLEYKKNQKKMLEEALLPEGSQHVPVAITWRASLEALKKTRNGDNITYLMLIMAYLAPNAIPKKLLLFFLKDNCADAGFVLDQCLRDLRTYSLIQSDGDTISLHRLVQDVVRIYHQAGTPELAGLNNAKIKQSWFIRLFNIIKHGLNISNPNQDWYNHLFLLTDGYFSENALPLEQESFDKILLPHLQSLIMRYESSSTGQPSPEFSEILTIIGIIFSRMKHPSAKLYLERAWAFKERYYEKNHINIARTLIYLGNLYGSLGDAGRQEIMLKHALNITERYYGKENLIVAHTMTNLSNAYGRLGRPTEQKKLLERALQIHEKHDSKDSIEMATLLENLGSAYGALGNAKKKLELEKRALEIYEQHYGKDHIETARTLVTLGDAYGAVGDVKTDRVYLERALRIQTKYYGEGHIETARTLANLGITYGNCEDSAKMRAFLEKALAIQVPYYSRNHVEVARTLANLGNAYLELRDLLEGKKLLEEALSIQEPYYGRDHIEVATTLSSLGNAFGLLGDLERQKKYCEEALSIYEKRYDKDNLAIGLQLANLANIYPALGQRKHFTDAVERGLEIFKKHYHDNHLVMGRFLLVCGNGYWIFGNLQKSRGFLQNALSTLTRYLPNDNSLIITLRSSLSKIDIMEAERSLILAIPKEAETKNYLDRLESAIGYYREQAVIQVREEADCNVITLPLFWLRQLGQEAIKELSKELKIDKSRLRC